MSGTFDLLLTGGTVLNPATWLHQELDVGVSGGRIVAIQPNLPRQNAKQVLDVRGCYVTPGLIDFHIHSYWGVNPYGFNADPICMASGVTTAVDAGSAGPINFLGFKKLVAEPSRTRMLAFVALAQHGVLNDPGELQNLGSPTPKAPHAASMSLQTLASVLRFDCTKRGWGITGERHCVLRSRPGTLRAQLRWYMWATPASRWKKSSTHFDQEIS
ncbi:MAG TPA: hypothetical protein VFM35_06850 [Candidatus Binatia bacterium]|nr:hypothetical protein [Candidatus Binatia bacterium]